VKQGNTMSASAIAAALADRPVKRLPHGDYLCPCPAHDDHSPSLSIRDGPRGLIVHCWAGCEARDVYAAIRAKKIKIERGDAPPNTPIKRSAEYQRRQREKAGWFWRQRKPIIGSIAETYLREARGYSGPLPPTLAFLPPHKPEFHPALIAAFALVDEPEPGILGKPQHVTAIHLTFLKPDGSGKAEAEPNKISVGSPLGKPIVLAPPNDLLALAITEGIEDALTAYQATGVAAWAAGSAYFMLPLAETVPDYIECITVYADPDKAGQDAARKLANALRRRNIETTLEGII
jgi:Toprim domain